MAVETGNRTSGGVNFSAARSVIWEVGQTRRFARIYKEIHDNQVAEVDAAFQAIAQNPDLGDQKKVTWPIFGSTSSTA
jgi:hypothetical protein